MMKSRECFAAAVMMTALAFPTIARAKAQGPAGQNEILAGVRSCAAATSKDGVDARTLAAEGWSKGSMSNDGKAVATDLTFYGKGNLMLLTVSGSKNPICTIIARITDVQAFATLQAAMAAAYGAPIKDDGNGEQMFIAPDHRIIDLASTGAQNRPSVRIAVGPVFQEKQ